MTTTRAVRTMEVREPYSPPAPPGTAPPPDPTTGLPLTGLSWKEFWALIVILLGTVTLLLSLIYMFVACFPVPGSEPMSPAVMQGRVNYMQSCKACHGTRGEGKPGLGKPFTTSEFLKSQSDEELVEFIKVGRSADDPANTTKVPMPPKGGNASLTDDDLRGIVSFMRVLSK